MNRLIYIITFFVYSGYYAGLAIIFALNLKGFSRFYSVPLRVVMAFLMIIIIIRNRNRLILNRSTHYIVLFIIFWIFYALKVLYTENSFSNAILSREWYEFIFFSLLYVVIPFIAFYSIDFDKYRATILNAFIFSGSILGLVSTYLYGNFLGQDIGRLNMITYLTGEDVLSPLAMSYAGVLTLVLCFYKLIFTKVHTKLHRWYLYSTIVLSFIMFLLGSSRGSVVALMFTLPLFVIYSPVKQKAWLILLAILSTPLIIWAIEASGSGIFDRIGNTSEDKGGGRAYLWESALGHFADNPLLGGKIEIGGIYPHNFLIEILMATGFIGALLILPVVLKGFALGFQQARNNLANLYVLFITVIGFVQFSFSGAVYTAIVLFVPLGIIFSIRNSSLSDTSS